MSGEKSVTVSAGVEKVPPPEARMVIYEALKEAHSLGDINKDGELSKTEFDQYRQGKTSDYDKRTTAFVDKHFGAIALLSKDNWGDDLNITKADIENVEGGNLRSARANYVKNYEKLFGQGLGMIGAGMGSVIQAGDVMIGAPATAISTVGHGAFAVNKLIDGQDANAGNAFFPTIGTGFFWGPCYGYRFGKSYGDSIGAKYGGVKFDYLHGQKIKEYSREVKW